MAHFAVSSMFFHGYPLEEIFSNIEEAGFDGIEFWLETPHFWIRNCPVRELLSCIRKYPGLALTMHTPVLDLNPCSINPSVAEISRDYAAQSINLAEQVGAEVVTLHPGRRTVKRIPGRQEYKRFGRYLDLLRSTAKGKRVKVSMENMEPAINAFLYTPESIQELLDAEPWLYFTLDTAHALISSLDEVYRYLDLCGKRLVNIHLSRSEKGMMHLPLNGTEGGKVLVEALKENGYSGHITLEIEDRNFSHDLSLEERLTLLMKELHFLHENWD